MGEVPVQAVFKSGVYLPELDLWLDSTRKREFSLISRFLVEVGQFGVGQPAQRRGPCSVGRNCVTTDAQNLGIVILEPLVILTERGCLSGSTSGEV